MLPIKNIREIYKVKTTVVPSNNKHHWNTMKVDVYVRDSLLTSYLRNYSSFGNTFEPFQQLDADNEWHPYALVSQDYTTTAVMDLLTGKIIAKEKPDSWGFCPVDFYVPDWWEYYDEEFNPNSEEWDSRNDWDLKGRFGFVAGCIWGDDSSWKIQYLDLSEIQKGKIKREELFGYIQLPNNLRLKDAIELPEERNKTFSISVQLDFNTTTGKLEQYTAESLLSKELKKLARHNQMLKDEVNYYLAKVVKPEAFDLWWNTPVPSFDNKTPKELWLAGEENKVLQKAKYYSSPEGQSYT